MERVGERQPLWSEGSERCTISYVHMDDQLRRGAAARLEVFARNGWSAELTFGPAAGFSMGPKSRGARWGVQRAPNRELSISAARYGSVGTGYSSFSANTRARRRY